MNKNVNSDDEEIAILEDDDPGLDSTDNENEGKISRKKIINIKYIADDKFFGTEDAPLLIAGENDEALSGETTKKMSRSERRAQRNKIKTDPQSDDELGEFQTLESAERQRYEWWGAISKDKDFNGLHHSSKN